jgi:hypothetical protein
VKRTGKLHPSEKGIGKGQEDQEVTVLQRKLCGFKDRKINLYDERNVCVKDRKINFLQRKVGGRARK